MKTIFKYKLHKTGFILVFFLLTSVINAQTYPKTFNYQAVARTDEGYPIADKKISVEISILQGVDCELGQKCNIVYQEIHYPTTNEFGLFAIEIGNGQNTFVGKTTVFSSIDWTNVTKGNYFVKIRVDFGDAEFINGLLDMGTTKLQSVPYSLVATKSDTAKYLAKNSSGKYEINLQDLKNVTITSPVINNVLTYNGTNWINQQAFSVQNLSELQDVTITTPKLNDLLFFNGTKWVNQISPYIRMDGTTDLTGDWSISKNNIFMNLGNLTLLGGLLTTKSFKIATGTTITNISTDITFANNSDNEIPTQKAIKSYVDSKSGGSSVWTEDNNFVYYTGSKPVGIGTSTPYKKFHVNLLTDECVLITGTFNSTGKITDLNTGTRFVFFPINGSIRAGTVENTTLDLAGSTYWNNTYVGQYSVGFGYNTRAQGRASFSMGERNIAGGAYSVALGYNNNSASPKSFTAGDSNSAEGVGSVAFGYNNKSRGLYAFTCGRDNNALQSTNEGNYSLAVGENVSVKGTSAIAFGNGTLAQGDYSFVAGKNTKTNTNLSVASFACGLDTYVEGSYANGFGEGNRIIGYAMTAIGRYNKAQGNEQSTWTDMSEPLFVVGNGTGSDISLRSDAFVVYRNGNATLAGTLTAPSDKRLKTNINKITNASASLMKIDGVTFNWNKQMNENISMPDGLQYGVIAQNIEKIFPELVIENKASGYKTVNYIGFIPVLIEAFKEQQNTINNLQSENNKLKTENLQNQTQINQMNNQINDLNARLKQIEEMLSVQASNKK